MLYIYINFFKKLFFFISKWNKKYLFSYLHDILFFIISHFEIIIYSNFMIWFTYYIFFI